MLFCLLLFSTGTKAKKATSERIENIDSLLTIVSSKISSVCPASALLEASQALTLSRETGYSKGSAISCFYIGQIFNYLGDYKKSINYLNLSQQEKYTQRHVKIQSEISRMKGQTFWALGLNDASLSEFHRARDLALKIRDKKDRNRFASLAYENLSLAYKLIKDIPDSSLYYMKLNKEVLDRADETNTFRNKINLYALFGEYYATHHQYDSAQYYFEGSLALTNQYDYPYTSWLYSKWGNMYKQRGMPDSALHYYRKCLDNILRTQLKNELADAYLNISDTFDELGMSDSCSFYMEKYHVINSQQMSSRFDATEEAMSTLLQEEKRISDIKIRRISILSSLLFLVLILGGYLVYHQVEILHRKKESEVMELQCKLDNTACQLIELIKNNDPAFLPRFREIHPEFMSQLTASHPDLTDSELRLAAMTFLNLSSKEIADFTYITHRSAQTKKSRLRKKLGIPADMDLFYYLTSLVAK